MILLRDLSIFWCMFHVIILFIMLFRSRYTKRKTILLAWAGMGFLMVLNGIGLYVFGIDAIGKAFLFTCSIPSFIFFYVLSLDKRARFLFTFCLADTSCYWVMVVTNLLEHYLGGGQYILLFISRLLAFPLIEYCAYRFFRRPYLELQNAVKEGWGIFAGMTLLYYLLLAVIANYPVNITARPEDVPACVLVLLLMFFNYATIFSALYRQLLLYRKLQSERILQEQKNSLEAQLENQQRIRRMKHDMKGHTVTLSGLLAAGRTKEALEYLAHVETEMDMLSGQFCPNLYLNSVFAHYNRKFQDIQAEFRSDLKIGEEELPYIELCQILSNGLENACDALMEVAPDDREASVQMRYNRDYLLIRIKNRCREGLYVEKGMLPATSKKGADHGFGLSTIQEAAEKLGGDMLCYTDNGSFVLDVMVRYRS